LSKIIGFIINPIAGMGGKVGLKGTDGADILAAAIERGAEREAPYKAKKALAMLAEVKDDLVILTASGDMGESVCGKLGFSYNCLHSCSANTTAADTEAAVRKMLEADAELILFAGGDGTARNVYNAIQCKVPVIGIPAGVKIQSAVFAIDPESAGRLAYLFLQNVINTCKKKEVVDLDENAYRQGYLSATLYGYMQVPLHHEYVQNMKQSGFNSEQAKLESIASYVVDRMEDDCYYAIGPGTTAKSVMEMLNLPYNLLGVDIVRNKELVENDVSERKILGILQKGRLKIIVSPIGGQGFLFGRGNHQFSSKVLSAVDKENIIVVAIDEKLISCSGGKLRIDCDDATVRQVLSGYYNVINGYGSFISMLCE
jgi:predicted polyphosphate/ATP-dependent NAD kinase